MVKVLGIINHRHGKGPPPGYGPGPDLGPFFTNLDRTAVLFLGLERTWKVPDFLQIDRPVLFGTTTNCLFYYFVFSQCTNKSALTFILCYFPLLMTVVLCSKSEKLKIENSHPKFAFTIMCSFFCCDYSKNLCFKRTENGPGIGPRSI